MASKEECDRYAAELTRRFDELVQWAHANWPKPEFPLLSSDFSESRREISQIVGRKLGDADDGPPGPASGDADRQFRDLNPMPWP
ncbi:hypothetical protein [Noviherbaspirillum denitrificans]|uniref:hypothetical protein n=1 Tax=Noviherbaspirillum denitrificans TaxID=1968433 RepID=UPI001130E4E8|nr:hypothetical protein [Noviherbaspirillum denitrificans]